MEAALAGYHEDFGLHKELSLHTGEDKKGRQQPLPGARMARAVPLASGEGAQEEAGQ